MTATIDRWDLDVLQPFMLDNAAVRGRVVRLGAVVDTILSRHAYPDSVSRLLAEALCVASLLAANLKQEGIITLQMRGSGAVSLLVVDAAAEEIDPETGVVKRLALRGYADMVAEKRDTIQQGALPRELFGEDGYLAITYDPGFGMQRYQGVVALEGASLADALSAYFTQSQQLDISVKLCVDHAGGQWSAGGLMVERIASEGGTEQGDTYEAWRTALAYVHTVTMQEMLDAALPLGDLLYRLFHEQGVRVLPLAQMSIGCRCSRERILQLLLPMAPQERADMVLGEHASVHCQFCNSTELFSPKDLELPFSQ